jgi:hypothetical protein
VRETQGERRLRHHRDDPPPRTVSSIRLSAPHERNPRNAFRGRTESASGGLRRWQPLRARTRARTRRPRCQRSWQPDRAPDAGSAAQCSLGCARRTGARRARAPPPAEATLPGTLPIVTDQFATVTVVHNEEIRRSPGATYCARATAERPRRVQLRRAKRWRMPPGPRYLATRSREGVRA